MTAGIFPCRATSYFYRKTIYVAAFIWQICCFIALLARVRGLFLFHTILDTLWAYYSIANASGTVCTTWMWCLHLLIISKSDLKRVFTSRKSLEGKPQMSVAASPLKSRQKFRDPLICLKTLILISLQFTRNGQWKEHNLCRRISRRRQRKAAAWHLYRLRRHFRDSSELDENVFKTIPKLLIKLLLITDACRLWESEAPRICLRRVWNQRGRISSRRQHERQWNSVSR